MSLRPDLRELATRTIISSREAKWRLYEQVFPPQRGERVLDVGVSSLDDLPGENYFLRRYAFPDQLTGVGINDLSGVAARYPEVGFVQADGRDLPFDDGEFDIVHSNAVVEHVGPWNEQARFVHELVRVSKRGIITTPNRWFPVESHLRVPVVHWLPRPATLTVLRRFGHDEWPVWLLSRRTFRALFPPDVDVTIRSQRIAGWPAVFIALFTRP
jgi:SAM-dependent methyltransferase